jgi:hypothetical protein
MAERIDAIVGDMRKDLSEAMTRANQVNYTFISRNYILNRKPDYLVYIYNVSQQTFEVSRPPYIKRLEIKGCSPTDKCRLITSLPVPLIYPNPKVDESAWGLEIEDTRRIVMDMINPDNLTLDQELQVSAAQAWSQGQNLGVRGVFWSLNGPGASKVWKDAHEEPTEEEIKKAITRMERHYKSLLEQARQVEVSSPAKLSELLTLEHNYAADYFDEERSWHKKQVRAASAQCPNCGTMIREGVAFHKTEEGVLCIIDWNRAVRSGVRTKAQAFDATNDPQFAPGAALAPIPQAVPTKDVVDVPSEDYTA